MTIIVFFLGLALGVCLYAIARWAEYFVDIRRAERAAFMERRDE